MEELAARILRWGNANPLALRAVWLVGLVACLVVLGFLFSWVVAVVVVVASLALSLMLWVRARHAAR